MKLEVHVYYDACISTSTRQHYLKQALKQVQELWEQEVFLASMYPCPYDITVIVEALPEKQHD